MEELLKALKGLELEELSRANETFPKFASGHEGYAVMLEEYEETIHELAKVKIHMELLWTLIKDNEDPTFAVETIEMLALNVAAEALQVSAMARKFMKLLED